MKNRPHFEIKITFWHLANALPKLLIFSRHRFLYSALYTCQKRFIQNDNCLRRRAKKIRAIFSIKNIQWDVIDSNINRRLRVGNLGSLRKHTIEWSGIFGNTAAACYQNQILKTSTWLASVHDPFLWCRVRIANLKFCYELYFIEKYENFILWKVFLWRFIFKLNRKNWTKWIEKFWKMREQNL